MAASFSDMNQLRQDSTFQGRVRAAMISTAISVSSEGYAVLFHRERAGYAAAILNAPDTYMPLFANTVSTDTNVINDATATGTVVLTGSNVAAQAALVTDAHISAAISSEYNAFFRTPA